MVFCVACFSLLKVNYPVDAKKNLSNYSVVLDTPEYTRVTELKSHMSNVSCFSQMHTLHKHFHILLAGRQIKYMSLYLDSFEKCI